MAGFMKAVKFAVKYQACADELIDLVGTLHSSVKDGKIEKSERSSCLSKYWNLVKAVEKVG